MSMFLHDLRLAARSLLKSPGYALVVIPTLALGIGANTAIFSVVYGVLLRPLPYRDPGALVIVQGERDFPSGTRLMNFSAPELDDWVAHSRAFESLGMVGASGYALSTDSGVEAVSGRLVSEGFFATLGQPMALGRPLGNDEGPVVVVSHRLWQRRFGGDPQILGRPITLTGQPYTVVGVAGPDFRFPDERTEVWTPLAYARQSRPTGGINNRNGGGFHLIARLKRGVTLEQARQDVANVIRILEPHFTEVRRGMRPHVTPLARYVSGTVGPALLMLLAAVGLVLLIACANVANLLLARHLTRARETAVRVALGAARGRLVIESLAESTVIAVAGGAAGVALAAWGVSLLRWLEPAQLPRLYAIQVDGPVLLFATGISLTSVLLSGLAPAIHASRADVASALRADSRTQTAGRRARRLRSAFVVAELALAIVLLVGATLVARSLVGLLRTDLGVTTEHVITALMDLAFDRTPTDVQQATLAESLVERVSAIRGVEAAGAGSGLPPNRLYTRVSFTLADPFTGTPAEHMVSVVPSSPGYFSTLRIPLVKGRFFSTSDGPDAPPVMIVTDDAARRFFGNRDPIGQTLPIGPDKDGERTPVPVVGVVKNVKYTGIDAATEGVIYRPYAQQPFRLLFLVARTSNDPLAVAPDLRQAIRGVDRQINIVNVRTLDQVVSEAVAQPRFRTVLLTSIAALALILAAIGVYGVIAYSVSQRSTEIGVRIALGASSADVLKMIVREAALLAGTGSAIGLAGAYALTRTLSTLLYGVTPRDAASFAFAVGCLLLVVLVASYMPARRATRIDPIATLRAE